MRTTRMRMGTLVTAGVLTLGLAACGGDDDPATTPTTTAGPVDGAQDTTTEDAVGDAAEDTTQDAVADAGEDATQEPTEDAAGAAGEEIPVEEFLAMLQEPGEETLSRYELSMDLEVDGEQSQMEGAVDLSGDTPKMRVTMSMPDLGTVELIFVDSQAFMAIPGMTPEGSYLAAPPEMLGETADLDELDVTAQWEMWEQSAEEVRSLGEEDVDGTEMRRYQVTMDAEAAAAAGGQDGAAATSLGMEETVVYDVWLDADNLMRKMIFEVDGEEVEMRLDNWGEDPGIEAPDPDQVSEMDDLGGDSG